MNKGGWGISTGPDENGFWHVAPHNDSKAHMTEDCTCGAAVDPEEPTLIVHNSFDGREPYETGERKVS